MPTYVTLVNFTDHGIKNFRDTVRRAEDYRGLVEFQRAEGVEHLRGGCLRQAAVHPPAASL